MKIGIVIQARDGSIRLPNKSTRKFYKDKSILDLLLERFEIFKDDFQIVVATTNKSPKVLENATEHAVFIHCGEEDRVLDRYVRIARRFYLNGIIRICGDNPFIQLALLYPVMKWAQTDHYDYVAFKGCMLRHEGFFCEYISRKALERANEDNPEIGYNQEHVTPYIYNNPDIFTVMELNIPPILDKIQIRLTVDTKSDFYIARKIYKYMKESYWGEIIKFLEKHPKLLKKMKKNIDDNPK